MRAYRRGEPKYTKRTWTSAGRVMSTWRVRWRTGRNLPSGGAEFRERAGFATKEAAQHFWRDHVAPALDQGYGTPEELTCAREEATSEEEKTRLTIGSLLRTKLENKPVHLKKESFQNYRAVLRLAMRKWDMKRDADAMTDHDIELILAMPTARDLPASPDTIRKRFFVLSAIFQEAEDRGKIRRNPCRGIKMPKQRKGRLRFLEKKECIKLLKACRDYRARNAVEPSGLFLQALVAAAMYSGGRKEELLTLEWTDVSADRRQITIQPKPHIGWEPKNGKPRTVGVNRVLFTILDEYQEGRLETLREAKARLQTLRTWADTRPEERKAALRPVELDKYTRGPSIQKLIQDAEGVVRALKLQISSPFVFPNPWDGGRMMEIPKAYWHVLESIGLRDSGVVFHTLRHTYASQLAMAGVDIPVLKELMGHSSIMTTMRYAHLSQNHHIKKGELMPDFVTNTGEDPA